MDRLVPRLEDRGFRVRALSLGACGDDGTSPFAVTIHTWANDICTAAESMNTPKVLLGHSMGGYPISLAGEKRPDLFNTLNHLQISLDRGEVGLDTGALHRVHLG